MPPVMWTGFTVRERSQTEVIVEQESRDKAARIAKALPGPNEPIAQQRAKHCLTRLPFIDHGVNTVLAQKENSDRENETLAGSLSCKLTTRSLQLDRMFNNGQF